MKIKNKIFISFSSAISILLVILGVIIYMSISNIMVDNIQKLSLEIAESRAGAISRYIEGIGREMKTEAERNLMKTMDKAKIVEDLKKQIETRKDTYDIFFISDIEGNYTTTEDKSGNIADREYFKKIVNENKEYAISEPLISKATGKAMFVYAYAIKDDSGKTIGVLGNNISLNVISNMAAEVKVGKTGYGWIMDKTGLVFAHPSEEIRMKMKLSEADKFGIKISKEAVERMINNDFGIEKAVDGQGKKVIIINSTIPNSDNWTFAISVPEKEIYEKLNMVTFILILLILIIVGITAAISITISEKITKPITEFVAKFQNLADGDLTVRSSVKTGDELEMLSNNFNLFTAKLENVVSNIKDGAVTVAESSSEINKANDSLAQKASTQASALEETSSTMEEISSIISGNTVKTQEANDMMVYTAKKSEEIENLSMSLNSSINDISNSSKKIENIIDVIDEIAFQTNLLALNAAVEAARAGEQGRGFAVVAVEVRNLAARSGKAAKEIKELIGESVDKVEQGSQFVDKTIKSIQEIVTEVRNGSVVIADIAASAKEQMEGVEQVNKAIADLDEVTQTNAGIAQETSASTHILYEKANDFLDLVEFFKVSGESVKMKQTKQLSGSKKIKEVKSSSKFEKKAESAKKIIPFDDEIEEV